MLNSLPSRSWRRTISEASPNTSSSAVRWASSRELEVLKLVALGDTNPQIGDELHLSIRTVEAHRSHLQHKIHRSTRAEVSAYAREQCVV